MDVVCRFMTHPQSYARVAWFTGKWVKENVGVYCGSLAEASEPEAIRSTPSDCSSAAMRRAIARSLA
jgi:hypothetical protein